MKTRLVLACLLGVGLLGYTGGNASASTLYNLDLSNGAIGSGPWGSVTVGLIDSTHATIEFDIAAGFMFVGPNGVGANVGGTFTLGTITATNSILGTNPTWTSGGSNNTFGSFTVRAEGSSASFSNDATKVVIDVTDTGTAWASSLAVLALNSYPAFVTAHIGVCKSNPCVSTEDFTSTGYAAGDTFTGGELPLPAAVWLMGSVLASAAGVGGLRKKRKNAAALAA